MRCATCGGSVHERPMIRLPSPDLGSFDDLTTREYVVAMLMASGESNAQLAARMGIGEKTVKSHITTIIGKLRASGRTQVAVAVVRAGLVEWIEEES